MHILVIFNFEPFTCLAKTNYYMIVHTGMLYSLKPKLNRCVFAVGGTTELERELCETFSADSLHSVRCSLVLFTLSEFQTFFLCLNLHRYAHFKS